jgi:hypothetical protein
LRIQPDCTDAVRDQASTVRLATDVLRAAAVHAAVDRDPSVVSILDAGGVRREELNRRAYPGLFAAAFEGQSLRHRGDVGVAERQRFHARLREAAQAAVVSAERVGNGPCPQWAVDLPPVERHLQESLRRAKAQIPTRDDRAEDVARLAVRGWTEDERSVHCGASCLLASVWPEMLAEVATMVRQVALLEGFGIDGFTDFASHGAVFVNSSRLQPSHSGLPPEVRLAEALVHEATHNRCNAAAVRQPFLEDAGGDAASLVHTPLRNDPRPLTGLFQQLVVIVRCWLLYERLLASPGAPGADGLRARRDMLRSQGLQASRTLRAHQSKLSDHGRSVVAEAEHLLNVPVDELA